MVRTDAAAAFRGRIALPWNRSLAPQTTRPAGQARPVPRHGGRKPSTACAQANGGPACLASARVQAGRAGHGYRAISARAMRCFAAPRVRRVLTPAAKFSAPGENARGAVALAMDARRSRAGDRARAALRASRPPPSAPAPCAPRQRSPRSARAQAGAQVPARRCSHRWEQSAARDRNDYLPRALHSSSRARRRHRRRGLASRACWKPRRA
jgi:hypothetical protein